MLKLHLEFSDRFWDEKQASVAICNIYKKVSWPPKMWIHRIKALMIQFPIYLEQGVESSYLIYWQLGAWFQIYRELEDEGRIFCWSGLSWQRMLFFI